MNTQLFAIAGAIGLLSSMLTSCETPVTCDQEWYEIVNNECVEERLKYVGNYTGSMHTKEMLFGPSGYYLHDTTFPASISVFADYHPDLNIDELTIVIDDSTNANLRVTHTGVFQIIFGGMGHGNFYENPDSIYFTLDQAKDFQFNGTKQ